ncbi:MAG: hypothetical protein IH596_07285 [Bacteroidales bacterium]|nr:hypothetical protein [Bacteroidales bacterium]
MKYFLIILCSFLISLTCFSQLTPDPDQKISIPPNRLAELDAYAKMTPRSMESNVQSLADYLMVKAGSEAEMARLVFSWMAYNIKYDARSFNSGQYGDMSATGVLKSRLAVCAGFANLFQAICGAGGLECVTISGYSKGYGYRPKQKFTKTDHTWNAVKINGEWYLMDATWGQGYGETRGGRMVAREKFDDYWFAPPAREFIFTHLPEDPQWQFQDETISKEQFEQLPYIDPVMFYYGFNPEVIFAKVLDNKKATFVEVFTVDSPVEILAAPVDQKLRKGTPVSLNIKAEAALEVVALNANKRTMFQQQGNLFTVTFTPEPGDLFIGIKFNSKEKDYQIMLKYLVQR